MARKGGGTNPLKAGSLFILWLVAQGASAISWTDLATRQLSPEEINTAANSIVGLVNDWLPSFAPTGIPLVIEQANVEMITSKVPVGLLEPGFRYKYGDREFEYDTWQNVGGKASIKIPGEDDIVVDMNEPVFELVVPSSSGGKRRKTLRRKK